MTDLILVVVVIALVFSGLSALIAAFSVMKVQGVHELINSRMDQLLALTRVASRAEGVAQEQQDERDRQQESRDNGDDD